MKISAVVLTKNEEKNIKKCLESLLFCDEIIVIDDYSQDKTVKVVKNLKSKSKNYNSKVKIFKRKLSNDFASQRNYGLKKVKNDWVLFADADETVSRHLSSEILSVLSENASSPNGFYLKRQDVIWGKPIRYGEAGSIRLIRLGRKGCGNWKRKVHEYWDLEKPISTLENPIIHYPHENLREFISNVNRFSTLHAQENKNEGKKSNVFRVIFMPVGHFTLNFIFKMGFRDKMRGLVYAIVMSFHSFLAWGKLYLMQKS